MQCSSGFFEFFCSTALTSTGWVRMTIKLFYARPFAVIKSRGDIKKFSWKRPVRESNPGRQGGKRERYLCAMPTPYINMLLNKSKTASLQLRTNPVKG
jgi:hypothetical protein